MLHDELKVNNLLNLKYISEISDLSLFQEIPFGDLFFIWV